MNKLHISTNQASYEGGETVFGVVYVEIFTPTSATTVTLEVQGYETYNLRCLSSGGRVIQDMQEYIFAQQITILKKSEPLSIGKYVIPFQVQLPKDIPASFHMRSMSGPEWQVKVYYGLHAYLYCDRKVLEHKQELLVYEPVSFEEGNTTVIDQVRMKSGKLSREKPVEIEAFIDYPVYHAGDNVLLSLRFTKRQDFQDPIIKKIHIKLVRELKLYFNKERFLTDARKKGSSLPQMFKFTGPVPAYSLSGFATQKSSDQSPPGSPSIKAVLPENEEKVVFETTLVQQEGVNLFKGVEKLRLKLNCNLGTVHGKYAKHQYSVKVYIYTGSGNNPYTISLPVPHVKMTQPKLKEEPVWVEEADTHMILSQHKYSLNTGALQRHHFNNLPLLWNRIDQTMVRLSGDTGSAHSSTTSSYITDSPHPSTTSSIMKQFDSPHTSTTSSTMMDKL